MTTTHRPLMATICAAMSACTIISLASVVLGPAAVETAPGQTPIRWEPIDAMRGETIPFAAGESITYRISWRGVHCADLRTSLENASERPGHLLLRYEIGTSAMLDWAWKFRSKGLTWLDSGTLLPRFSYRIDAEKDETERSWTVFHRTRRRATHTRMSSDDEEPDTEQIHFLHGLDIPAAFLMVRALELNSPGAGALEIVHEDKVHALLIATNGWEEVKVPAGHFPAQRVDMEVRTLWDEPREESAETEKYRRVRVWLSERNRVLLRLEADVFGGHISIEATSIRP